MATNIPPPKPLAYEGQVVIPYINRTSPPNSSNISFNVPTIWVNTSSKKSWILLSKELGVANWVHLTGSRGTITDIYTPIGGPVTPLDGAISFASSDGIEIDGGTAPSDTVTFNLTTPSYIDTLTTSTGAFVAITTIPVASGTSIVLEGRIIGSNAAHDDITGGNLMACADGTLASLVGFPVVNVETVTTATFKAIFSAGNLVVQVQAPSSDPYNWKFIYSYNTVS